MALAAGGAGRSLVSRRPPVAESQAAAAAAATAALGLLRIPRRGLRGWGKGGIVAAMEGSRTYMNDSAEDAVVGGEGALHSKVDCVNGSGLPRMSNVENSSNILWHKCSVEKADRELLLRQKGCVIWVTGLSGSGKSTLACALARGLHARGKLTYILDGDNVRHGLNSDLSFKAEDRAENIRRMGEVAKLFADAGVICIASLISPYLKDREMCRSLLKEGEFIEVSLNYIFIISLIHDHIYFCLFDDTLQVFMDVPLSVCESRDPKGLYKLARAGMIRGFTGIDDPYEPPLSCEIVLEQKDANCDSPDGLAGSVISYLEEKGYLSPS